LQIGLKKGATFSIKGNTSCTSTYVFLYIGMLEHNFRNGMAQHGSKGASCRDGERRV